MCMSEGFGWMYVSTLCESLVPVDTRRGCWIPLELELRTVESHKVGGENKI